MSTPSPFIEEIPWWRRLGNARVKIASPHSRDECVRRLKASIDPWWKLFGLKPVAGYVFLSGAALRKRISYQNAFQTIARLQFRPSNGGTEIICWFRPRLFVVVFVTVWFLGVIAFPSAGLLLGEPAFENAEWVALAATIGLLAVGAALVAFGRYLARNEKAYLLDFVRHTLSASEVPYAASARAAS